MKKICPDRRSKIDFLQPIYAFFNQNCLIFSVKVRKIVVEDFDEIIELPFNGETTQYGLA